MPKSIFVSYVYQDKSSRDYVARWFASEHLGPERVMITESEDLRQQGERAIENHLKPLIRGAAAVLCIIGQNTHNSSWVEYELDVATSLNKLIVLARLPGTSGAAPPRYRHLSIVPLDPSTLRKLI